jgi:hypothetical protein
MQDANPSEWGGAYSVIFQGGSIACATLDDAADIQIANRILIKQEFHVHSIQDLYRYANVLARYGRQRSAQLFSHWACRMRVAKYFAERNL